MYVIASTPLLFQGKSHDFHVTIGNQEPAGDSAASPGPIASTALGRVSPAPRCWLHALCPALCPLHGGRGALNPGVWGLCTPRVRGRAHGCTPVHGQAVQPELRGQRGGGLAALAGMQLSPLSSPGSLPDLFSFPRQCWVSLETFTPAGSDPCTGPGNAAGGPLPAPGAPASGRDGAACAGKGQGPAGLCSRPPPLGAAPGGWGAAPGGWGLGLGTRSRCRVWGSRAGGGGRHRAPTLSVTAPGTAGHQPLAGAGRLRRRQGSLV